MEIIRKIENCEYKGEKFDVEIDYYYDDVIGEYYVDSEIGNNNLRRIRNEYRKIKNLLTDDEIKEIRNNYKLSQRDYSVILGFGEVTVTRYESKTVQDKAQDQIIRASKNPKTFLKYLRTNKDKYIALNGEKKYNELCLYVEEMCNNIDFIINQYALKDRGNTIFKISKLKTVINEIINIKDNLVKTTLAKLLWYIDFSYYNRYNKSITGLVYKSMPFGAYPMMYEEILHDDDFTTKESWINDYECCVIESVKAHDILTQEEQEMIKLVVNNFKNYSAKKIVEYMHKEKAYIETPMFQIISYEYAKDLSIWKDL